MTAPAPDGMRPGAYDDDLRDLLAAHGAGHEPDLARIRARLDAGLATARQQDRTGRVRHRLGPPVRVAAVAAASLVAAAAVLLAVIDGGRPVQVSTTGPASASSDPGRTGADNHSSNGDGDEGRGGDGRTDTADPAAAPLPSLPGAGADPTAGGDPGVAGTDVPGIRVPADAAEPAAPLPAPGLDAGPGELRGVAPGTGSPGSTVPPGGTTPPTTVADLHPTTGVTVAPATSAPTTTTRPTTARPTAPPFPGGPAIQTGLLPQQVQLGPVGYVDWVVVGSRSDGKIVRMNAGPGRLAVSAPSGALPTPGLVPILWSGGSPEQDRTENKTWWTADAGSSSFVVQVAGADNASEVVLYASSSSSLTVTVTVSGRSVTQKAVSAGFFGTAAKVTVTLTGADRGRDVTITLGAPNGSVSLGAVTER